MLVIASSTMFGVEQMYDFDISSVGKTNGESVRNMVPSWLVFTRGVSISAQDG